MFNVNLSKTSDIPDDKPCIVKYSPWSALKSLSALSSPWNNNCPRPIDISFQLLPYFFIRPKAFQLNFSAIKTRAGMTMDKSSLVNNFWVLSILRALIMLAFWVGMLFLSVNYSRPLCHLFGSIIFYLPDLIESFCQGKMVFLWFCRHGGNRYLHIK